MRYDAIVLSVEAKVALRPCAINASGDVLVNDAVGSGLSPTLQEAHPGLTTYLWKVSNAVSFARGFAGMGLNNRCDIVGSRMARDGRDPTDRMHPTYYHDGTYDYILPNGAKSGHALSINEGCRIVGLVISKRKPPYRSGLAGTITNACYWQDGKFVMLPNPEPDSGGCLATGQNDEGVIIGSAGKFANMGIWIDLWAMKWEGDRATYLVNPPGCIKSLCKDVNNRGDIVGWVRCRDRSGNVVIRSVVWSSDGVTDLLYRDGITSFEVDVNRTNMATGINDSGAIVGWSRTSTGGSVAYLLEDNTVIDLNTVATVEGDYRLFRAAGINNSGQIICQGLRDGGMVAVLLSPR